MTVNLGSAGSVGGGGGGVGEFVAADVVDPLGRWELADWRTGGLAVNGDVEGGPDLPSGELALLTGGSGTGKSSFVLGWLVRDWLARGWRVLWLDYEQGEGQLARMARRLQLPLDLVRTRLVGLDLTGGGGLAEMTIQGLLGQLQRGGTVLDGGAHAVVVDSLAPCLMREAESMGLRGSNPEDSSKAIVATFGLIRRLAGELGAMAMGPGPEVGGRGAQSLVIDHVGVNPDAQDRPRGSAAKIDQAFSASLMIKLRDGSADAPTVAKMISLKDRSGEHVDRATMGLVELVPDLGEPVAGSRRTTVRFWEPDTPEYVAWHLRIGSEALDDSELGGEGGEGGRRRGGRAGGRRGAATASAREDLSKSADEKVPVSAVKVDIAQDAIESMLASAIGNVKTSELVARVTDELARVGASSTPGGTRQIVKAALERAEGAGKAMSAGRGYWKWPDGSMDGDGE